MLPRDLVSIVASFVGDDHLILFKDLSIHKWLNIKGSVPWSAKGVAKFAKALFHEANYQLGEPRDCFGKRNSLRQLLLVQSKILQHTAPKTLSDQETIANSLLMLLHFLWPV